ncbi:hypothetical protein POSPLADRAFT_1063658, partial [Postia placenta MAD-698-R-SB12]
MFLAAILNIYIWIRAWCIYIFGISEARIVLLPFGLVLKVTTQNIAHEGHTIEFVRKHTSIPVPCVFVAAEWCGRKYLLMKKVEGDNLEWAWQHLDAEQRSNIVLQLRSFVLQLRALRSPHGPAVCGLNGVTCIDSRISSQPVGPFPNESAFNDGLIVAAKLHLCDEILADIRSRMRNDHRIALTHGDLAPRNIFVRGGTVVAVIDWEESGWYPEHWEFVKA